MQNQLIAAMASVVSLAAASLPAAEGVTVREDWAKVPGARLWYWDTGGDGPAVVLVHPATGSGLIWDNQRSAIAKAGYRVIGYSRKHHAKSEVTDLDEAGSDVDDLHAFAEALSLSRFHAIGSAAGGGLVMQYAVAHPDKLLSMTIACSLGSVEDEEYWRASSSLRPPGFSSLPASFRELGPTYRAANPEGVRRWEELVKISRNGEPVALGKGKPVVVTWDTLNAAKIPALLLGGGADLYLPPPLLKYFHERMPGSQMVVVDGAGHSVYWEQPDAFNRTVLEFIGKHSGCLRR